MYTAGAKGGGKGWEEKGKRGRETGKIEICGGNRKGEKEMRRVERKREGEE